MNNEALQKWFGSHARENVQAWLPLWAWNVRENARRGYIREDRALHRLTGMFPPSFKCVLAGPGPSLDLAIPWLQTEPQNVVAINTALNPLLGNGIQPVVVVATDAQAIVGQHIAEVAHLIHESAILVCPVTVHPAVIENWPGQIAFYVTHDPTPEFAAVDLVVKAALDPLGLSKESLGSITAGGCVGCAALEAAFYAGFREILVVGYELGATPADNYYGQRFSFEASPPSPIAVEQSEWSMARKRHNKSQSDRYRLAFEQRLEWMAGQDPAFEWSNLSPYSFLQGNREAIPAVEPVSDLVEVG